MNVDALMVRWLGTMLFERGSLREETDYISDWTTVRSGLHARLEQRVLGAFAELRKASSHLSVRMVQHDSHWTDFHEI